MFPTTIVGSYPQPDWLIDRQKLAGRFPPRVRAKELWRVADPYLQQAQDDATVLAIRAQEDAGLDIVSDGEIRRESYRTLRDRARRRRPRQPRHRARPLRPSEPGVRASSARSAACTRRGRDLNFLKRPRRAR